jgi:hypothetical protein
MSYPGRTPDRVRSPRREGRLARSAIQVAHPRTLQQQCGVRAIPAAPVGLLHCRRAGSPTRARPRQWREILADALAQREAISVRSTVIDHLRRTPTRAEATAARRAAHGLAASGQATILRIRPPGFDGPGSPHLVIARPGIAMSSESLDELADVSIADRARQRFEPMARARDLAEAVELLCAAVEAIPADRLHRAEAELVAVIEGSLETLRRIKRQLRRGV